MMRRIEIAHVTRGAIAWTSPFRFKPRLPKAFVALPAPQPAAGVYTIDRDRIFDYLKKNRLPSERSRQIRRDTRNAVDFYTDVRDLQTPSTIVPR